MPIGPRRRFALIVVATWLCNARCDYCFERRLRRSIREPEWGPIADFAAQLVDRLAIDELDLYWQGGEVLALGPESLRFGLETVRRVLGCSRATVRNYMQTNLLLYDEGWRDLLREHFEASLSSSLDFPNLYRRTPRLDPQEYSAAWLEAKKRAEDDGFTVSAIAVPNQGTLQRGARRFLEFFRDEAGVKNVQINLPFPGHAAGAPAPPDPEALADFFDELFDHWVAGGRVPNLNPFTMLEAAYRANSGRLSCCWCFSCAEGIMAVGPGGIVAQCDCWLSTHPDLHFGCVTDGPAEHLLGSPVRDAFRDRPAEMVRDPLCAACPYWASCHGGCPVRAYTFTNEFHSRDRYCAVYRRVFERVQHGGPTPVAAPWTPAAPAVEEA